MPKRSKKEAAEGDAGKEAAAETGGRPPKAPRGDGGEAAPYEDPPDRLTSPGGQRFTLKVTSWNVDGLRAWVRKQGLQWVQEEAPDVLCLQETKCAGGAVPPEVRALPGLPHQFWASAEGKAGYSGVGLLARHEPLSVTYGIAGLLLPQNTPLLPQKTHLLP